MALRRCLIEATLVGGKRTDFGQWADVSHVTERTGAPSSHQHTSHLPAFVSSYSVLPLDYVDERSMLLDKARTFHSAQNLSFSTLKAINSVIFLLFCIVIFSCFKRSHNYASPTYKENDSPLIPHQPSANKQTKRLPSPFIKPLGRVT